MILGVILGLMNFRKNWKMLNNATLKNTSLGGDFGQKITPGGHYLAGGFIISSK